jgi:formate dehydrogenase subunit delta
MNQIKHENDAKLARMAGQIALFYRSYPEQEAVEGVAAHINKFWSGQMRQNFLAAFSGRDECLDPIVRAAFALVRAPRGAAGSRERQPG